MAPSSKKNVSKPQGLSVPTPASKAAGAVTIVDVATTTIHDDAAAAAVSVAVVAVETRRERQSLWEERPIH